MQSLIEQEFSKEDSDFWLYKKDNKFLHNIDTFYYSVKLSHDFTRDSKDRAVIEYRKFMQRFDTLDYGEVIPFHVPEIVDQLNIMPFKFGGFYKYCFECPEKFDIFICEAVPHGSDHGESVTSEIIVQIRSYLLWTIGPVKAFEYSYDFVKKLCSMFNFDIQEVKENRVDYCWHSNYLKNPSKFFRIDNFVGMQVSRFNRVNYQYQLKPNDEYENDYISFGKRSNKIFVRIYLKSKEVIEKHYKPWFFQTWFFNKLISRYDLYCYEEMFKLASWNKMPYVRLQFYLEYGQDESYKKVIKDILDNPDNHAIESVISVISGVNFRDNLITDSIA